MNSRFFSVHTLTPWESTAPNTLSEVKLLSSKTVFKKYPVIQKSFFDDLISLIYAHNHYSWNQTIKRIVGPKDEDYEIENFNFIWAMDTDGRFYQLLFQKAEESGRTSKGVLAAFAPPELAKLFSDYKTDALHRILSLLNTPTNIRFLTVLGAKGKSIAPSQQLIPVSKEDLEKLKYTNILKQMPNIQGEWFPEFAPKCPVCNEMLTELKGYGVGLAKLVCPRCGYESSK